MENARVSVMTNKAVMTHNRVQANKPDIVLHDKEKNEIWIIEVGITSSDRLQETEIMKGRKYGLLASELAAMYKARVNVVPYVMTWDGLVTTYHEKYRKTLGISKYVEAYIQAHVIKRTLVSMIQSSREIIAADKRECGGAFDAAARRCYAEEAKAESLECVAV